MIVVDASALLEFLLQTPLGARVEGRLFRDADEFHAPHLVDVEIVQGLRRLVRTGEVFPDRAEEAMGDLTDLDLYRHPHLDLATHNGGAMVDNAHVVKADIPAGSGVVHV